MKRRTFHPPKTLALGDAIAQELALPLSDAAALVRQGACYVGGRRSLAPERAVGPADTVLVVLEESGVPALQVDPQAPLDVLFEDAELLAVAKPAGTPTQPSLTRKGDSLLDAASRYLGRTAGLVHRLDRETSGVVLFGKTKAATARLALAFRRGEVDKLYLAVAGPGLPERGRIDLPLSKDPSRPGRYRATRRANGVSALTEYERLFLGEYSLVALHPKTGRTHQLRAHLTALGCPIAGDRRYQGPAVLAGVEVRRCLLHAHQASFPHAGRTLTVTAPLPEDIQAFFSRAGLSL